MKNILLAVTGLSPQVITETIYALHQSDRRVDAIHVITTRDGKEKIYTGLLGGKKGYYYRYLKEYGIPPESIDFGYGNIHVVTDEHGIETNDIANELHNERLLKKCMELAFLFTKDPETAVFFSIAGGRKTMSSCLTIAAQMYGRPQDRLYHVLVSPEFESNRDFYYPPKKSMRIKLIDEKGEPFFKETKFAEINLIPVPFFSVRKMLSDDFLKEPKDPATLMLSIIKEEKLRLTVNLKTCKVVYKTIELDLMPARMALYAFFIMQKKNCSKRVESCENCIECFIDVQSVFKKKDEITEIYKKIGGTRPLNEMKDGGIINLDTENFRTYKSRIKENLRDRYGLYALKNLEIASAGSRPDTCYGIKMDKLAIEVVW
jgi:CRISPR-associated protein (TIGR02584 family)